MIRLTVVWANLLQLILWLSIPLKKKISSGPPARNVFSVATLFSCSLGWARSLERQLLSNILLPRYLSNCSYNGVPSSILSLLIYCQKF